MIYGVRNCEGKKPEYSIVQKRLALTPHSELFPSYTLNKIPASSGHIGGLHWFQEYESTRRVLAVSKVYLAFRLSYWNLCSPMLPTAKHAPNGTRNERGAARWYSTMIRVGNASKASSERNIMAIAPMRHIIIR